MRVFSIAVPATRTSLRQLIPDENPRCTFIMFQAPEANTNTVFFGDHKIQTFELRPCANMVVQHQNIRDVHILGTAPDRLTVMLA